MSDEQTPRRKPGPKPKGGEAMSGAERTRLYRERKAQALRDQIRSENFGVPGKVEAALVLARIDIQRMMALHAKLQAWADAEGLPPGHDVRKILWSWKDRLRNVAGIVSEHYTGTTADWRKQLGWSD